LAFVVALIWAVHPLQTEAVTYVVQRAESLMGLFYLLTFYGFIRYAEGRRGWAALSVLACLLGMLTKEVTVTAPVLVWLYDRTFVSGTFREAWRRRRVFYLFLGSTWLALAVEMVLTGGNRGGSVGFGSGTTWWAYALTQFPAITTYLRLSVWPHPLVFDYGTHWFRSLGEVLPQAIVVGALVGGTIWALRRPRWAGAGFLGAWFFSILAPTSLVPGTTQMIVEHRMYLPLAAILVGVVLLAEKGCVVVLPRTGWLGCLVLGLGAAAAGATLTIHRNGNYRSALALWSDTVAKRPDNARAQNNLGIFLEENGEPGKAVDAYATALRLKPDFALAENNLGNALVATDRTTEAIPHYQRSLQLKPDFALAENNLGRALVKAGRVEEALAHYQAALRLKPDYAECHFNLGNALAQGLHRPADAIAQYNETLRLQPGNAEAECNLGSALLELGQLDAAIAHYEAACRIDPNFILAQSNLAMARRLAGRQ
jgi:Flp pilus assembly protein TadD